jgi:Ca2+-binding RTX toxin-like protein
MMIIDGDLDSDTIYGGPRMNYLYGGDGNDHLHGHDNIDRIFGGEGNDWLYGYGGMDQLHGEAGSDYLAGGASPPGFSDICDAGQDIPDGCPAGQGDCCETPECEIWTGCALQ